MPEHYYGKLPALVGIEPWYGYEYKDILGIGDREITIAKIPNVPRLLHHQMVQLARQTFEKMSSLPAEELMMIFKKAAEFLRSKDWKIEGVMPALQQYIYWVSQSTGLPEYRVYKGNEALASDLCQMEVILRAQSPDGTLDPYQTWQPGGPSWWIPSGRMVAVKVPANFPTINIMWLQVLASRRPVVLMASLQDPFTPLRLALALYSAGLPDGAISLSYGDSKGVYLLADQVIWPGNPPERLVGNRDHLLQYHQGGSKAVVLASAHINKLWERLAAMAVKAGGRICTKLSGLVVEKDSDTCARELALQLGRYQPLPLENPEAFVPAFSDLNSVKDLAARIQYSLLRGAIDYSAEISSEPLIIESNGYYFLRPTVLKVSNQDPLFGVEFPFPFVTVTEAIKSKIPQICKNSLQISVVGDDPKFCKELILEPTISKVFQGEDFDRKYDPSEPHQGYLTDFLFQKKAIKINYELNK